jgi:NO-binding membrane sensor protein with MHYT domain
MTDRPLLGSYDNRQVVLSVLIAILASYTALDLAGRVTASRGRARLVSLIGARRYGKIIHSDRGPMFCTYASEGDNNNVNRA